MDKNPYAATTRTPAIREIATQLDDHPRWLAFSLAGWTFSAALPTALLVAESTLLNTDCRIYAGHVTLGSLLGVFTFSSVAPITSPARLVAYLGGVGLTMMQMYAFVNG